MVKQQPLALERLDKVLAADRVGHKTVPLAVVVVAALAALVRMLRLMLAVLVAMVFNHRFLELLHIMLLAVAVEVLLHLLLVVQVSAERVEIAAPMVAMLLDMVLAVAVAVMDHLMLAATDRPVSLLYPQRSMEAGCNG